MIPQELRDMIQDNLETGETLLWAGRPRHAGINRMALAYTVITGLIMLIFMLAALVEFPDKLIWVIIFAAIIVLPGALKINSPSKETYFLTDRRIIIKHPILAQDFALGDTVSITPAPRAGRNSLKITERVRETGHRKKYRMGILHGLNDPDGFLKLISGLEYQIKAGGDGS